MGLRGDLRLEAQPGGTRVGIQSLPQLGDQFGAHFRRRRVRIGHDDHAAKVAALCRILFLQAVQHMGDQGRRLAAAGRGRDQQGPVPVADDLFLHGTGNEAHCAASFFFALSTTS